MKCLHFFTILLLLMAFASVGHTQTTSLEQIHQHLQTAEFEDVTFQSMLIVDNPDDKAVLKVMAKSFDEFPLFVTITDEQILIICYIFKSDEVKPDKLMELYQTLLKLNVPVPLSSFGILENRFVIQATMPVGISVDLLPQVLFSTADNAVEALQALDDFLR